MDEALGKEMMAAQRLHDANRASRRSLMDDGRGKTCGIDCACSQGECPYSLEVYLQSIREHEQKRRTDAQPGEPVPMRSALAKRLMIEAQTLPLSLSNALKLAAATLERDQANNAEMIDELVRAGYNDIPARIDANVIRRLLGYITPR